jgi:lipid-A-disaccharide synthase-like uncharacterized protein
MRARRALIAAAALALLASGAAAQVDLQTRLKDVHVVRTADGDRVQVGAFPHEVRLDPAEFVGRLYQAQQSVERRGILFKVLNITTPWGLLWVSLGFLGQALFTFRMVLQWVVSEREKRSVVPVGFWWGSLLGGAMLLVYFSWRKDIVGIVGQSTGAFVYARNLVLIYRGRSRARSPAAAGDPEPEPGLSR